MTTYLPFDKHQEFPVAQHQPNGVRGDMTNDIKPLQLDLSLDSLTAIDARFTCPGTMAAVRLDRAQWEQQGRPSRLLVTLEQN